MSFVTVTIVKTLDHSPDILSLAVLGNLPQMGAGSAKDFVVGIRHDANKNELA